MDTIQRFIQELPRMQWSDILDILLVAFLIYRLLPLIRTPSTMRIARTVFAVVVLAWVTDFFDLHAVNFILDQVLAVGLLAVVILFQPELRRMLDRLINMRFVGLFPPKSSGEDLVAVIAQTVMACEVMSHEKVGALIVFAREARLDDYVKTGTQIDALVSEQLIRNVFFPKAALHDGAMIIRDGQVTAAGCVLPLSDSNRLSADLGTRHRAGVGMSEMSDAVVVIVSEETGTISVAVGGMLKRHLAPQTLERLLRNELCPGEDDDQGSLKNLGKKLLNVTKEGGRNEKK